MATAELPVHSPLTTMPLLEGFMTNHLEKMVTGFNFRAKPPVFANEWTHFTGKRVDEITREVKAIARSAVTSILATAMTKESLRINMGSAAGGQGH